MPGRGDPQIREAVPYLFVCSCLSSSLKGGLLSSAADPDPTNKRSVLPPVHPARALPNNHTVSLSQDLRGHLAPRGWVPVLEYVRGGSLAARPRRGRLRAPSTWRKRSGGGGGLTSRLPLPVPSPPAPAPGGVSAHQSIAASMPWFPVRARAFSLRAETP